MRSRRERGRTPTRFPRLTPYDQHCLRVETPARPLQVGILAVLDGRVLLDPAGRLPLEDLRRELERRVVRVPELRRVIFRPGPLAGAPLWIEDRSFRVERHVDEATLSPPGDEAALLATVERLMAPPLERSRPLWRLWFLTGLDGGRVGVLVAVHHALADGLTAMRLVSQLLSPPSTAADPGARTAPAAAIPPAWSDLVRDRVGTTLAAALRLARPATWRSIAGLARYGWQVVVLSRQTPRSSLNAPVGPRRRLAILRLDQSGARRVARVHGGGVNDLVLDLVAGGVRALLDARGEDVARLRPRAGVAVALFSAGRGLGAGNDIGTLHVSLPLADPDPGTRLPLIASERARAKRSPMVAAEPTLRAWLARLGVARRSLDHQRLVNLSETYLPGPPGPIDILGAPVLDLVPVAPLAGNLGLSFVALSYAGRLTIAVRADADRFADLDVLTDAMERDWEQLAGRVGSPGRA